MMFLFREFADCKYEVPPPEETECPPCLSTTVEGNRLSTKYFVICKCKMKEFLYLLVI
ncbi:MAG TPA: hypothetical protein VIY08_08325 [Candidatus Nitrosocosmicus sp.]